MKHLAKLLLNILLFLSGFIVIWDCNAKLQKRKRDVYKHINFLYIFEQLSNICIRPFVTRWWHVFRFQTEKACRHED